MNEPVQVATDGACPGDPGPGPGGWSWTTGSTEDSGGQRMTTNQEMELRAILEALRAHPDQAIVILTDSQYAIDCVTTWLPGWRCRGWRTSARRPVKHQPTIKAIAAELDRRTVQLVKVPGHAGHPLNERADRLAAAAAARAALPPGDDAPAAVELLFSKRGTARILMVLSQRPVRFNELARAVPVARRIVVERLRELQDAGLVERRVDPGPPISSRYLLTAQGEELVPHLERLWVLAERL
jgi:ribonuclease HI